MINEKICTGHTEFRIIIIIIILFTDSVSSHLN